jgi:hypothetical protein
MSETPSFSAAIDVVAMTGSDGRFSVRLDPAWTVGGKPNGGYLAAVLARAGELTLHGREVQHPHCITSATSFLGAPEPDEAVVEIEVLRTGLGTSQLGARLRQGSAVLVDSSMTFARLHEDAARPYDGLSAPSFAAREDCVPMVPQPEGGIEVRVMEGTRVAIDPAHMGWARGEPSGAADLKGWAWFTDGEPVSPLNLLYLADCFPPATFEISSKGWVPTLQLTTYVRALPAPGPVRIRQRAQVVDGGFVDELCEIWDSAGRLVAQACQLAKVRF